jgi:hypothetical protein
MYNRACHIRCESRVYHAVELGGRVSKQILRCTDFSHDAILHDQDLIIVAYSVHTMSYCYHSVSVELRCNGTLNLQQREV